MSIEKTVFLWISVAILVICMFLGVLWQHFKPRILKKILNYRKETIKVIAYKKEFIPEQIYKLHRWRNHSRVKDLNAKYNVYYVYGYTEHVFNDKALYDKVTPGVDSFEVIVHRGYNRKGILKYEYHTLGEKCIKRDGT